MDKPVVKVADVPCNGCTACCKVESVILYPEVDDVASYQTEEVEFNGKRLFILKKNENGCVYLGEHGCTIHDRAPAICRAFDCREWAKRWQSMPRAQRRRLVRNGLIVHPEILEAAARLPED